MLGRLWGIALGDRDPRGRLADYVASGTVGDLDLYEVADLGVTPDSIQAVQVTMCARKDAASREVRCRIKSGAATANGAPHALTAGYV